jgi:hypothetical protein
MPGETKLVDTGAHRKIMEIFDAIKARAAEEALRPTAMEIAKEVASRAPTPTQEYLTMMYGGANPGTDGTPRSSGSSTEDSDNRIRFIKPDYHYLRNYLPGSFSVNGLTAGIGNVMELDEISSYSYVNYSKAKGYMEHSVTLPFWRAWDVGGFFHVQPKFEASTLGRGYPLKPTPQSTTWSMVKLIPSTGMFQDVDLSIHVEKTLIPRINKIVQSVLK